jgi:hypothetical protein
VTRSALKTIGPQAECSVNPGVALSDARVACRQKSRQRKQEQAGIGTLSLSLESYACTKLFRSESNPRSQTPCGSRRLLAPDADRYERDDSDPDYPIWPNRFALVARASVPRFIDLVPTLAEEGHHTTVVHRARKSPGGASSPRSTNSVIVLTACRDTIAQRKGLHW